MKNLFKSLSVFITLFFIGFNYTAEAETQIDESVFNHKTTAIICGYTGTTTLTNFPVLVVLSTSNFQYDCCDSDGSDIRFSDVNKNLLSHDIESWNTNGESYIWLKIPKLTKNTIFNIYYGKEENAELPLVTASDTWSEYVIVLHGGNDFRDASDHTASILNGDITGSFTGGKIGCNINKPYHKGLLYTNPVRSTVLSTVQKVSVSGWFKRTDSNRSCIIFSNKNNWGDNGFLALVEGGTYFSVSVNGSHQGTQGKGALIQDEWGYLAFSYNNSLLKSYFNNTKIYENSNAITLSDNNEDYWTFGGYLDKNDESFVGDMDELRVYNGSASDDWIKAEYDSVQSYNSFIRYLSDGVTITIL